MGISKSIDADETTRKLMENRKDEIRREFEADLAKNVADFWSQKEAANDPELEPEKECSAGVEEKKEKGSDQKKGILNLSF